MARWKKKVRSSSESPWFSEHYIGWIKRYIDKLGISSSIWHKMAEFPSEILDYRSQWEQFNLSKQLKHVVSTSSNLFFPVLLWRKEITYKCIFNALLTHFWLPLIEKSRYLLHPSQLLHFLQTSKSIIKNKIVFLMISYSISLTYWFHLL